MIGNLHAIFVTLLSVLLTTVSSQYFGYTECKYNTFKAVCMGNYVALRQENNGLTAFPSVESGQTCVQLRQNYIERFPKDLTSLENVVTLDIAANRISSLPDDLEKMQKLEILDVSENRLEMLSHKTRFPASLRGLLLANNKMKTIPEGVVVPGLFVLDLSQNMFTDITEQFCLSDQLIRVDFTDNPLRHDVSGYINTVNKCKNVNGIPFCLFTDKTTIKCDCSSMGPLFSGATSFCMGSSIKSKEIMCSEDSGKEYGKRALFDVNLTVVEEDCNLEFTTTSTVTKSSRDGTGKNNAREAGPNNSGATFNKYTAVVLIALFTFIMCM